MRINPFGLPVPAESAEDPADGVEEKPAIVPLSVLPFGGFEIRGEAVVLPVGAHDPSPSPHEPRISVTSSRSGVPGIAMESFVNRSSVATMKTHGF